MSNRRKARLGRVISERCSFCGHAAGGPRALRLRTGQVACPHCQERGSLQRLSCGHYGVAGALKVNTGTWVCTACAGMTAIPLRKEL